MSKKELESQIIQLGDSMPWHIRILPVWLRMEWARSRVRREEKRPATRNAHDQSTGNRAAEKIVSRNITNTIVVSPRRKTRGKLKG